MSRRARFVGARFGSGTGFQPVILRLEAAATRIARNRASTWLTIFALLAAAARAEIEFIGVLVMPGRSTFALTDDPAKPATWRTFGQSFAGYRLTEFDEKTDTLTLAKDGATLRVRLKDDAKVKNARVEIAGALKIGAAEKIEITRATLVFDQENTFPLKDGLVFRITPKRLPDGTILYSSVFERTDADGKTQILSSPKVVCLPDKEFGIQIGDLGFSFAPKTR